jgi:hypothetical protein
MIRISSKTVSVGLIALACMLATSSAADASNLTYTATGGLITGTLNGTPFTDATWSLAGTADPTNVISGNLTGFFPYRFLANAPLDHYEGEFHASGNIGDEWLHRRATPRFQSRFQCCSSRGFCRCFRVPRR